MTEYIRSHLQIILVKKLLVNFFKSLTKCVSFGHFQFTLLLNKRAEFLVFTQMPYLLPTNESLSFSEKEDYLFS